MRWYCIVDYRRGAPSWSPLACRECWFGWYRYYCGQRPLPGRPQGCAPTMTHVWSQAASGATTRVRPYDAPIINTTRYICPRLVLKLIFLETFKTI